MIGTIPPTSVPPRPDDARIEHAADRGDDQHLQPPARQDEGRPLAALQERAGPRAGERHFRCGDTASGHAAGKEGIAAATRRLRILQRVQILLIAFRSMTATLFAEGTAMTKNYPSGVGAPP